MTETIDRKLKLGLSTYSFPWSVGIPGNMPDVPMKAEALLLYSAHKKISRVQFGDNLPLHVLPRNTLEQLKDLATSHGIQVEVGMRGLTPERLLRYLEIGAEFHSSFLRVVIDDDDYRPNEDQVTSVIRQVIAQFAKAGVVLAIENHDRFTAASLQRIILQTDKSWVGICLDTVNSLGAGEGFSQILPILLPYTINLHVKDFEISRVASKMGFEVKGTPSGKGMLDIPAILEEISAVGRCETATLETWMDPEKTIEETIDKENRWVAKSIDYLKKYIA